MDIGLDDHFDITLDDRNDLPQVTGRRAFEQKLRVRVTDRLHTIIGQVEGQNALRLVRLEATRVVQNEEAVDGVAALDVSYATDDPNTIEVTVVYDTNDDFTFSLSE